MESPAPQSADVIILGGGLVGGTLALALARSGVSSHLIDMADPKTTLAPTFDGRVSAISSSSMAMFDAIGLGEALRERSCPIERIAVSDGLQPGALAFQDDSDSDALGFMVENRLLREVLHAALLAEPLVAKAMPARAVEKRRDEAGVTVTLDSGAVLTAPLLAVCEGRNSRTRDEAGIRIAQWTYDHDALVCGITHDRPHNNVAAQIFYPGGPFALLPMLDDAKGKPRAAIVWSLPRAKSADWAKLSDRALEAGLKKAMGGLLGEVKLATPRFSYPLGFHHTARMTAERMVLVGDAAHGMHPIAGQGLNVGLRDVAALAEVLVEGMRLGLDPADAQLLERYERWRGLDALSVSVATDSLTRIFGIPGKTASAARRFGLSVVGRVPALRRAFIAEARGTSGKLPRLLQGMGV